VEGVRGQGQLRTMDLVILWRPHGGSACFPAWTSAACIPTLVSDFRLGLGPRPAPPWLWPVARRPTRAQLADLPAWAAQATPTTGLRGGQPARWLMASTSGSRNDTTPRGVPGPRLAAPDGDAAVQRTTARAPVPRSGLATRPEVVYEPYGRRDVRQALRRNSKRYAKPGRHRSAGNERPGPAGLEDLKVKPAAAAQKRTC